MRMDTYLSFERKASSTKVPLNIGIHRPGMEHQDVGAYYSRYRRGGGQMDQAEGRLR